MNSIASYYERQIYGGHKNLTPKRTDISADFLKDAIATDTYVKGVKKQVIQGLATLRDKRGQESEQVSQLLFGEHFMVYEEKNGWAWGQSLQDFYVGYVPLSALDDELITATHRVSQLATNLYVEPDGKSKSVQAIPYNSKLRLDKLSPDGRFIETAMGYVPLDHIEPIEKHIPYVEMAKKFIGTPYLWGGRSLLGIDCSGLVQAVLCGDGVNAPRDTGMQFEALKAKNYDPKQILEKGDIVFFPGHVGIMADSTNLIHANAHHMATVVEPLGQVVARLSLEHDTPVTGVAGARTIASLK